MSTTDNAFSATLEPINKTEGLAEAALVARDG